MFSPPSSVKRTLLFREPLTENSLVPRGRILLPTSPLLLANAVTPGASSARSAALRPFRGSSNHTRAVDRGATAYSRSWVSFRDAR
jgi:hypothetical protein